MEEHTNDNLTASENLEENQQVEKKSGWKYVILALFISFILQILFLPCMCAYGNFKITFALYFDGLVLLQTIFSLIFRVKSDAWKLYAALCYLSPGWITLISALAGGH